jgi:multiple sugar transport system substrate-binding protein
MRRCWNRFGLLLLAMLVAGSAAGCRSLVASSSPSGAANGSSSQIVLDFWNGFTGPDGKTMEALVRKFQEANPDVRVRMQIIPWGTYYDKLTLSLAFGGAPELFVLHAARLPEYASFGVLREMSGFYQTEHQAPSTEHRALGEADFAPVSWRATFYEGRQYAMPLDVHPIGLYYNRRLFRDAGIVDGAGRPRPPTNWEEFLDAARRMTRDLDGDGRPDHWGFVFTYQRTNWFTIASQYGARILTADGRAPALDAPENVAALERMRELIYTHHVAPKPEGIDAWLQFRQGKVGMVMEGIYMLASLEEQKHLDFAGAPAPQFGPRPGAWAGSHLLCQAAEITPEAERAGWRLMRFLSDHSLEWSKGGQIPTRRDVLRSREFAALPVQWQFARQLPYVVYEPSTPKLNAIFPFVDPAIEATLLNLQTPQAAMRDASRRIRQVLQRP